MASSGTRVTAEALATTIQKYEGHKQEFTNAYLRISNVVRELSVNYKSEAATAFYNKFNDIYTNLSQTESRMDDAVNKLKQVKDIYEALTALQEAVVRALETDFSAIGNIFG